MPSEYQQDYKKTLDYAPKIYNDPNMTEQLKDVYRALESRYVHEGRTIDPSFYQDLNDKSLAKSTNIESERTFNLAYFIIMRMYYLRDRSDKVLPYGIILTRLFKNLKENLENHPFDERDLLFPRKMSSLKAKQPKRPPPKRTRSVGKSKHTQLTTSSSFDSPPSDNGDLPSTKLSPRSNNRALPIRTNMSVEKRETRGMFKNLARALHKFAKISSRINSPNIKRKTIHWVVKTPTYVNLESSSKEHQNEKTPSPPPRKKSLSLPHAPSKSTSSRITHYTSSSSLSESSTPIHVAPLPKLRFVIPMKQEPQELSP
ncbi:hypothetical protein Tco_0960994 [Tanacetum coccineum]